MNQYREWENIHCIHTHANRRLNSNFLYQQRSLALFNVKFGEKIKRGESKAGDRDCGGTSSQLESPDAKVNSIRRTISFTGSVQCKVRLESCVSGTTRSCIQNFGSPWKRDFFRSTPQPCDSEHQRDPPDVWILLNEKQR